MSEPDDIIIPSSDELYGLALAAVQDVTVSELHGAVCGMVASAADDPTGRLLALLGLEAVSGEIALADFALASGVALDAEAMTFQPLVGDDDEPLADRLENLAAFSASFLAGLGAGVGAIDDSLDEEVMELVRDLAAISQVDTDSDELDEEEIQFTELLEFVRVAVVLIRAHALAGTLRGGDVAGDGGTA